MAKPRVYKSSTFYDLRQIRVELDKFIESLGYEPIRNEEGDIPYGKDEALQEYCYKEISNIDILVSIIGSRYGSAGNVKEKEYEYSVSQLELKSALKEGKQVFIFIDKNVCTEYETYLLNKGSDVKYKYVDNSNIYKFIEEIRSLPNNNNIKAFETADDITSYLREQFAGLFKHYIIENKRAREVFVIKDIENTAKTLREMVDYLKSENHDKDEQIAQIVKVNHPIVSRLKDVFGIKYNIYIDGRTDLDNLFRSRGYEFDLMDGYWERKYKDFLIRIYVSDDLFDNDGNLKYMKASDWNEDYFKVEKVDLDEDELPF